MTIIGIDLGTTNSACGIWTEEGFQLIPNRLGDALTPSVVSIDSKGEILIGKTAKERLISYPDRTIASFKRLMGSNYKAQLGKEQYSATELSGLILTSLKEDAETFLKQSVTEAVISVPAYFSENQRFATKQAAELIGLKVERLINEPTAAAMAYSLNDRSEGTFLILDLGGGTFDVSILEFFDGVMEVHATAGDNFLGGEDFTDAMIDDVLSLTKNNKNVLSAKEQQQLAMQMETVKRTIAQKEVHEVSFRVADKQFTVELTLEWLNRIYTPLLLKIKHPIERALRDADLTKSDIDEIILVGGATRMTQFRSMISKMMGRLPICHLDPDIVVARGAAIQAGLKSRNAALDDIVLTDVCPYTLGTGIVNSDNPEDGLHFLPIIDRNSTVPISIVKKLWTASEEQTFLRISIYQGESRLVNQNVYLGELKVNIPKGPKGQESVDVRYSYDMNGLLEVDVKVCSSGKTTNLTIEQAPGALTEEQLVKAKKRLNGLKMHPRENEINKMLIEKGERLYQSSLGETRDYIANVLATFERTLNKQNQNEILKQQAKTKEILSSLDNENWL